ncbi:MAG TPA: HAMP domain-containing sensor histidine kinase [Erysipelothrix sp.]|nr:HAMP domain-containing sensor histidine kinase [Erysipelothrix sp.]
MFKKLKRNFVLLNMVIISSVMLLAFGSIFLIVRQNTMTSLKDDLNHLNFNPSNTTYNDDYAFEGILPSDYKVSFQLALGSNLELLSIKSYIDMPIYMYQEAVDEVIHKNQNEGTLSLGGKTWMYQVKPQNNIIISYLDITQSIQNLNRLGLTFIVVGGIMLGVIYFISVYFANKSLVSVEDAWLKQKEFIANASHELKTPLSILSVNADALTLNQDNQWAQNIKTEIKNMNNLISDLLDLAQSENTALELEMVDLSSLLQMNLSSFEVKFFEEGKKLTQSIEQGLFVQTNKSKVSQIIRILLDNALKYSAKNIDVILYENNKNVILEITNDGDGLDDKAIAQIFNRFYKVEDARSQHDASYGLGLSIAKNLSDALSHNLSIESKEDKVFAKIIF